MTLAKRSFTESLCLALFIETFLALGMSTEAAIHEILVMLPTTETHLL